MSNIRMSVRNMFLTRTVKQIRMAMEKQVDHEAYLALKELLEECEAHGVDSPADLPF